MNFENVKKALRSYCKARNAYDATEWSDASEEEVEQLRTAVSNAGYALLAAMGEFGKTREVTYVEVDNKVVGVTAVLNGLEITLRNDV